MNLKRDTYAIVDLDHLKYNVELAHNEFKRPLMAVIKADAYGHGYKEVASFLKDIDYVEMFAVATLPEAIELRELGIDKVLITAEDNNVPSYKTIEALGGVLENKVNDKGKVFRRYFINLED